MTERMISYAQNFEDVMLARALSHVEKGYYVDIGAQHPIVDSVSLAFYESGWRGLHVEPIPEYAQLLRQHRPDETVIQAAVGDEAPLISVFEIANSGLSTAREDIARSHEASGFLTRVIEVPCISLAAILDRAADREVHWLKIDVEGMERDVLRSWKASHVRPWIVLIEATRPLTSEPNHFEWEQIILELGYRFAYFDGLNRFYVSDLHQELLEGFNAPPNVFDAFELAGTASNTLSRRLQKIVDDTRAERNLLDLKRQSLEATLEQQIRAVQDSGKTLEAISQALAHSNQENEALASRVDELRLRDEQQTESQRHLNEELTRLLTTIRDKDQQIVGALTRIEEFSRQRDMLREETNRLQAEWRAEVNGMREAARAERDALCRVNMERENRLHAQLGSMQSQMRGADDDRKTLELKLRSAEEMPAA